MIRGLHRLRKKLAVERGKEFLGRCLGYAMPWTRVTEDPYRGGTRVEEVPGKTVLAAADARLPDQAVPSTPKKTSQETKAILRSHRAPNGRGPGPHRLLPRAGRGLFGPKSHLFGHRGRQARYLRPQRYYP